MSERILSIQSHVTHGYVGGKAAVFPLQLLGYDVDACYGRFGGSKSSADDLNVIFGHLEGNGMLEYTRLLTGYVPGSEALSSIAALVQKLKERNKGLIYLLDPVMGDAGKLYVSPEVVPIYKSMLSFATIITPNWFEVKTLTGVQLSDIDAIGKALQILHSTYNVPNVVISSLPISDELHAELPGGIQQSSLSSQSSSTLGPSEHILCICSTSQNLKHREDMSIVHAIRVPKINGYFSGVGDLFSALVLGHFSLSSSDGKESNVIEPSVDRTPLSIATLLALRKTYHVLLSTHIYVQSLSSTKEGLNETDEEKDKKDPMRKVRRMKNRELRLVQEQDFLRRTNILEVSDGTSMVLWDDFWEEK